MENVQDMENFQDMKGLVKKCRNICRNPFPGNFPRNLNFPGYGNYPEYGDYPGYGS